MRALRWRAAMTFLGVLLVIAWVVMAGGASYVVQIDFAMGGEMLEGAVVEIDGDSIGTLQRYGRSQFVTGFEVEPGDYVVTVRTEECEGRPKPVSLSAGGARIAVLMAEYQDGYDCKIGLW